MTDFYVYDRRKNEPVLYGPFPSYSAAYDVRPKGWGIIQTLPRGKSIMLEEAEVRPASELNTADGD